MHWFRIFKFVLNEENDFFFGDIAGHMTFLTSIQIFHLAYKQLWSIHKKNGHRFVTIHLYIVQI